MAGRELVLVAVILMPLARAARADDDDLAAAGVSDEVSAGATAPTSASPRSGFFTNTLGANLALARPWLLRAGASFTRDVSASAPSDAGFASQGGNVLAFSLGGTYLPTPTWILALELDGSPKGTTLAPTTFTVTNLRGQPVTVDAQLSAATSSVGASGSARWHVAKSAAAETELGLDAGVTSYATEQHATAFRGRDGSTVTAAQVTMYCSTHKCPAVETTAVNGVSAHLTQARFAASVTETLADDTDLGVTAGYFAYSQDPTQAGYYTLTSLGRRARTQKVGEGMPVEPERASVELDASHRFCRFEASLALAYQRFVSDQGYALSGNAQGKLTIGEAWSIWLGLGLERDIDGEGEVQRSTQALLGARREL